MKILDVYKLAASLHSGQTDKLGRPYIEHLSRVFLRVCERDGNYNQQVAALLHDAIEDGKGTAGELLQAGVPAAAVALVMVLTKDQQQSYLEYVVGVKAYPEAVLVKRCDLEDNSDPERLALLDMETAERLRTKYGQALKLLDDA
ncbi:HD domain-containing protein [Ralstonia solanacearum]|uniref:HD domain-containing protein n=1 Tax=Ralstonia solanacearum TaxID=305 RepID=A0AAE3NJU7_RALSL|nr:HD domain-containing protein [Ralstonia solanacearum]MBB6583071.1 HD domain-containing protein [Ralstonia solanacearum]MDB0522873.1 HD domain-containing protein [Ralstonia solanacearum]MDC6179773.1 HD domain-containing protein [Ralstonia solanacearum]MDC6208572.1 HD domain-containing protein [Ralstonia solanacearum]MDC6238013.1 HD domain-containing protein [Ralstonia solanacearum]